jgi:hypothetical protein
MGCYIMQMLHTSLGKSKKKKPTAKQKQLQAEWEKLLKKYEPKTRVAPKRQELRDTYSLGTPACRETPKHPSLPFTGGACALKPNPVYTGTKIKGIGTMHKSNAVPVFSDEEARDIATMRRG